ncbi:uncharacterized protein SOCE26_018600 [Sorangium cellulosum]|uniref:FXSXX-COOH protein n=1 Tax=Sorangium cellulosum TaxID=56 RepID=A0A2L0EME5_SORCE|nr:hypothetical protein [Sorangium cellulosum]AUX40459.1 uncharacterized protein SOCE26_018600 [Sorangium cellulosum]
MDRNSPSHVAAAPDGDGPRELDLATLNPDPEQIRKIPNEAVRSAMLSVADLREGRQRGDSLTLGEFGAFTSAPRPGVLPES